MMALKADTSWYAVRTLADTYAGSIAARYSVPPILISSTDPQPNDVDLAVMNSTVEAFANAECF